MKDCCYGVYFLGCTSAASSSSDLQYSDHPDPGSTNSTSGMVCKRDLHPPQDNVQA